MVGVFVRWRWRAGRWPLRRGEFHPAPCLSRSRPGRTSAVCFGRQQLRKITEKNPFSVRDPSTHKVCEFISLNHFRPPAHIIFRDACTPAAPGCNSECALYQGVIPPANRRAIISKSYDSHFLSRPRRALKRQWGLLENRLLAFLNLKRAK